MLHPLLVLILALPGWTVAQNNVNAIIQRSVEPNQRDGDTAPQVDYFDRDRGNSGSKTYEEIMILGSPCESRTRYTFRIGESARSPWRVAPKALFDAILGQSLVPVLPPRSGAGRLLQIPQRACLLRELFHLE